MVYAKFGMQTKCIMGNVKMVNEEIYFSMLTRGYSEKVAGIEPLTTHLTAHRWLSWLSTGLSRGRS